MTIVKHYLLQLFNLTQFVDSNIALIWGVLIKNVAIKKSIMFSIVIVCKILDQQINYVFIFFDVSSLFLVFHISLPIWYLIQSFRFVSFHELLI